MKALILCAGKGTRLGLKKTPKCMVKVNGKPVLEHLVNHLNKAGITEIIVNVHENYEKIFKYFGTRLLYLYEPTLLGEAGTEKLLQNWLGDEYIVMNGDTLTNIDLRYLVYHRNKNGLHCSKFTKERYGGAKIVRPELEKYEGCDEIDDPNWYYLDCGTPAKLAKARKFFKNV